MNAIQNNCNAYDNTQNLAMEDVQSIFERNIGKYAYLETVNGGGMFIIIRNVDKRNNSFNFDFLFAGTWRMNFQNTFNNIIRFYILDTTASGFVNEQLGNPNNNYCIY